ncbi:MAG: DUF58 domain-containing protein [Treponema sp.]|jgi:uncharacterized protein (DUF58 family)|nr:DUF58 domain-containing protein [Treponema sp.]
MEKSELLRYIINLPITSIGLAEEMLSGGFRSIFRGKGMEFDEARHYQAGDDIRTIDWNASARFGYPFVKMYREERELTILLLIDISPSMHSGSVTRSDSGKPGLTPYEQALICASLIAFSAEHTGQRAGSFFFDKDVEKIFLPSKGRKNIMIQIMTGLQFQKNEIQQSNRGKTHYSSNIAAALITAQRLLKKRALVVVISDFFSINWEHEMAALCRKHDCIALRICGPRKVPYHGLITLEDPETGIRMETPAGLDSFKHNWENWHNERFFHWESQCRKCGAAFLDITTEVDAPAVLKKFFSSRNSGQYRRRKKI